MKLLEYIKTHDFRVKQMSRGWKIRKKPRRDTKYVWKGERNHFNRPFDKEEWSKRKTPEKG